MTGYRINPDPAAQANKAMARTSRPQPSGLARAWRFVWLPPALVVLGIGASRLCYWIAGQGDSEPGALPDALDLVGLLGLVIQFAMAFSWPVVVSLIVVGFVKVGRARRAARALEAQ